MLQPKSATLWLLLISLVVLASANDGRHRGHHSSEESDEDSRERGVTRFRGNKGVLRTRLHGRRDYVDDSDSDSDDDDSDDDDSYSRSDEDDSGVFDALRQRGRFHRRRPSRRHHRPRAQGLHGPIGGEMDVDMIRLDPAGNVNVRSRAPANRRGRRGRVHRRLLVDTPKVHVQHGVLGDELVAPVGGKTKLGLRRLLPDLDDILPHLRGNLQVGPRININWNIGHLLNLNTEWWKGPNVCQSEYQTESNSTGDTDISRHGVTSQTKCDNTDTAYTCTTAITVFGNKKTFVTTYECCHGYQRVVGEMGCTKELNLTDLISTAEGLILTEFTEAVTSVGLDTLINRGNFTVFAPVDEAFDSIIPTDMDYSDYYDLVEITPDMVQFAEGLDKVLGGHLVEGFLKSSQLEDEMILDTINPGTAIRVNKYEVPTRLVTANCQPVIAMDNLATNGVIHVVSGMLSPVENSLLTMVSKDPELSTLKTLLAKTGLSSDLSEVPGQFTVFAPTNAAFGQLNKKQLDRLTSSRKCLSNILKHHLVGNVICSSILQSHIRTGNLVGGYLHFNKSGEEVMVEEALMTEVDLMATNGVLHKIDKVLIPDQALGLLDIAEKAGATEFLDLVSDAALTKTLETEENITVFVPSNEAIQTLPAATLDELKKDPVALAKILKFHIVPELVTGRDLCDGRALDTLESSKKIRIKDYSSFPFGTQNVKTLECAPVNVKAVNVKACNGIIHVIDQVMLPPVGDVIAVLSLESQFSTLMSLLKKSGMADDLQLSGPFTLFAPTNQAFEKLPDDVMEGFTQGTKQQSLKKLLEHHIMYDTLCCSGIMEAHFFTSQREQMLDGSTVVLSRGRHGDATVNSIPITSCDITATNGVIHAIDDIIPEAIQKYTRHVGRSQVHQSRRLGSRVSHVMDVVNSRLGRLHQRMDDFEWEFEWPTWMKRGF